MLEFCRHHASTKQGQVKLGLSVSILFVVAVVFGVLILAQPYAVYATGERVSDPWVVSIDGQEIALVESKEAGEMVETGLRMAYASTVEGQQEAIILNDITVTRYELDGTTHPVVRTADEVVGYILDMNAALDQPLVSVVTTEIISSKERIPYGIRTIQSDTIDKGVTSVKTAGSDGQRLVTRDCTLVNGEVVESTLLSSETTIEPVDKVYIEGTHEEPAATGNGYGGGYGGGSYGGGGGHYGSAPAVSASSSSLADYACQFNGYPYAYGGSNPYTGADCSGFTQYVYGQYGVSLPHNSYAQGGYGTAVSAADAQPGDLVCYGYHVGIYVGNGTMIHASTPAGGIKYGNVYAVGSPTFRRVL